MGAAAKKGHHESHGSVSMYWIFCVILCVITFVEWLVFHQKDVWKISDTLMISSLAIMSLVKFVMVVGWYMHLRYDHNWIKYIFISSLLMGAAVSGGLVILN